MYQHLSIPSLLVTIYNLLYIKCHGKYFLNFFGLIDYFKSVKKLCLILLLFCAVYSHHAPYFIFAKSKIDTNIINAVSDYETTPDTFFLAPPENEVYIVNRLLVTIEDNLNPGANTYGGISGGLANGVEIKITRNGQHHTTITNGLPIKNNSNWASFCFDVQFVTFGAGNNFTQIRWSFFKSGKPLRLEGPSRDTLEIILTDDLSSLEGHYFQFQGYDLE